MLRHLTVRSRVRSEMIDITQKIQEMVDDSQVKNGLCHLFVLHTTAAVTVNEGADPHVKRDIVTFLDRLVPRDHYFTHAEGNSDAHIKSSLVGTSLALMVEKGKLVLGTWQAVYFCEFDGPRERKVAVRISAEPR
ncbi:MAG TPA: secondary thiamine-phosphate synthase enzyme YjbQ [Verrucomicrobiae bacterium]|nr:secondary thiamine-phosphate synthase enzyme YjbQ [Verrucomicrobiae bacterium]